MKKVFILLEREIVMEKLMIENKKLIGNKDYFGISYAFLDDEKDTEIEMYVKGSNILEFKNQGAIRTTRWNLEELAMWLRNFIDNLREDPYPVEVEGRYAAEKDDNARDFETEDEDEMDKYYDNLQEWYFRHNWHTSSSGAILADVYFQLVGDKVEISWDNRNLDEGVEFSYIQGGADIDKEVFVKVVNQFLNDYADHWFVEN